MAQGAAEGSNHPSNPCISVRDTQSRDQRVQCKPATLPRFITNDLGMLKPKLLQLGSNRFSKEGVHDIELWDQGGRITARRKDSTNGVPPVHADPVTFHADGSDDLPRLAGGFGKASQPQSVRLRNGMHGQYGVQHMYTGDILGKLAQCKCNLVISSPPVLTVKEATADGRRHALAHLQVESTQVLAQRKESWRLPRLQHGNNLDDLTFPKSGPP